MTDVFIEQFPGGLSPLDRLAEATTQAAEFARRVGAGVRSLVASGSAFEGANIVFNGEGDSDAPTRPAEPANEERRPADVVAIDRQIISNNTCPHRSTPGQCSQCNPPHN